MITVALDLMRPIVANVNPLLYAVEAQRSLFANHIAEASVLKSFLAVGALAIAAAWAS